MKCWCGAATDVIDTRQTKYGVTRRRKCHNDHLFTTKETRAEKRDYGELRIKVLKLLNRGLEVKHVALQCSVSETYVRKMKNGERREVSRTAN